MSKEILMVAEAVSNEKGVDQEIIFEAIEQALAMATKKRFDEGANIRVVIDRVTGDYESFRWWDVVGDDVLAELGTQFTTEEAHEKDPSLAVGDTFEEHVDNIAFGRIAAQAAKQVIVQRVKDAERELIVNRFKDRVGELLNGTVKKSDSRPHCGRLWR
jgi:N utilization substance protein A